MIYTVEWTDKAQLSDGRYYIQSYRKQFASLEDAERFMANLD